MTHYINKLNQSLFLLLLFLFPFNGFAQVPDAIVLNSSNAVEIKNEKLKRIVSYKIQINNRAGQERSL